MGEVFGEISESSEVQDRVSILATDATSVTSALEIIDAFRGFTEVGIEEVTPHFYTITSGEKIKKVPGFERPALIISVRGKTLPENDEVLRRLGAHMFYSAAALPQLDRLSTALDEIAELEAIFQLPSSDNRGRNGPNKLLLPGNPTFDSTATTHEL